MKQKIFKTDTERRMFATIYEAADYLGLGINTARKICDEIGATRKIGRRAVFDRVRIDEWLDGGVNNYTIKRD